MPLSRTVAVVVNWHSALSISLKSESFSIAAVKHNTVCKNIIKMDRANYHNLTFFFFFFSEWLKLFVFTSQKLVFTCTYILCSLICCWIDFKWASSNFSWFQYEELFLKPHESVKQCPSQTFITNERYDLVQRICAMLLCKILRIGCDQWSPPFNVNALEKKRPTISGTISS